jgi:hypothetical protein
MATKFKVVEKGQPCVVGGGEKKFYASPVMKEIKEMMKTLEVTEERKTP